MIIPKSPSGNPGKSPEIQANPVLENHTSLKDRPFMEAVRNQTVAALAALSMSTCTPVFAQDKPLSPYEPLADASGSMTLVLKDTGDQIVPLMQSKGFAQSNINIVRDISDMIRKGKDAGLLQPGEYIGVVAVDPVSPNGGGLDGLINGGSKLPKQSFEAVTKASTLTRENYAQVVEALFDPSDVGLWMGGDEKEKTNYTGSLTSQKNRWLKKVTELETSGKGDIITEWFARFNALTKKAIHGSREEFRRGFIASLSMAQYPSMTPQDKMTAAPLTMTQTGEYLLITDPKANLIKVEQSYNNTTGGGPVTYGTLKYLIPADADFDRIGFTAGKTTVGQTLDAWKVRQVKTIGLIEKDKKLDTRKGELDTSQTYLHLLGNFNAVAKILVSQLDELPQKRNDRNFLESLNANLAKLIKTRKEMDRIIAQDTDDKIVSREQKKSDAEIYANIMKSAKLQNISMPKIDS